MNLYKKILKILIDISIISIVWFISYLIRFDGQIPDYYASQIVEGLPLIYVCFIISARMLNVYSDVWHYSSLKDVIAISLIISINFIVLLGTSYFKIIEIPFSVIILNFSLSILLLVSIRALRRYQYLFTKNINKDVFNYPIANALIIGAGDTAFELLRDIELKSYKYWKIIGLLDDSPSKIGNKILGHKVIGNTTDLESIISKNNINLIIIAMPSARLEVTKNIYRRCKLLKIDVKIIPSIHDRIREYSNNFDSNLMTLNDLKDIDEIGHTLFPTINFDKKKNSVLITGGAGYIGSHLVKKFLDNNYLVTVLDNFTYGVSGLNYLEDNKNLKIMQGDIANIRDITAAVKDCDTVVALAAIVGDPACGLDAEETLNLNYESTKILVEACNFYGVKRLIFASSCSVYGAGGDIVHNENSPINPVSLYAKTRVFSENYIIENTNENSIPVILRLSTVFGYSPRMRYDLVVNTLTANGVVNGSINVFGGNQWRPFIHCKDAADAFYQAAVYENSSKINKQILNVGSENLNYTINQIADIVSDEIGGVILNIDDQTTDLRDYKVSFEKIQRILGFIPSYDIRSGVREIIQAIKKDKSLQNISNPVYSNYEFLKQSFVEDYIK
tara:strand:+ start:1700 stop:3553 length:1854 start_codon:yes stop_codon:yes gene_type:complete